jgi:DNA-directed RNA polymerase subunit K
VWPDAGPGLKVPRDPGCRRTTRESGCYPVIPIRAGAIRFSARARGILAEVGLTSIMLLEIPANSSSVGSAGSCGPVKLSAGISGAYRFQYERRVSFRDRGRVMYPQSRSRIHVPRPKAYGKGKYKAQGAATPVAAVITAASRDFTLRGRESTPLPDSSQFTRFERARILGARALQVSLGAPILIDVPSELIDPVEIAEREYAAGVIPITVRRGVSPRGH